MRSAQAFLLAACVGAWTLAVGAAGERPLGRALAWGGAFMAFACVSPPSSPSPFWLALHLGPLRSAQAFLLAAGVHGRKGGVCARVCEKGRCAVWRALGELKT